MSATSKRADGEAYSAQAAVAREIRETIADQLHDLVIERESMGSYSELVQRVQHVGGVARQLGQARARQLQAREMGLPLTPSVEQEREALGMLRSAAMSLAAAGAAWAAAMDFEARKASDATLSGG